MIFDSLDVARDARWSTFDSTRCEAGTQVACGRRGQEHDTTSRQCRSANHRVRDASCSQKLVKTRHFSHPYDADNGSGAAQHPHLKATTIYSSPVSLFPVGRAETSKFEMASPPSTPPVCLTFSKTSPYLQKKKNSARNRLTLELFGERPKPIKTHTERKRERDRGWVSFVQSLRRSLFPIGLVEEKDSRSDTTDFLGPPLSTSQEQLPVSARPLEVRRDVLPQRRRRRRRRRHAQETVRQRPLPGRGGRLSDGRRRGHEAI